MGKFIAYAVVALIVGGGLFLGGVVAGGAWGSGMAAGSTADEIRTCIAEHSDETQLDPYREALDKCLAEAKASS